MSTKDAALNALIDPVVSALGFELWGIDYLSQGKQSRLVIYIDHPDGITVDNCANVSRQVGAVLDVEGGTVLAMRRRRRGVVFVVQPAGQVRRRTVGRRHPQVGRARVEDDAELLRRRAQRDLAEILSLFTATNKFE